jgi:hypothetical protein
MFFEYIDEVLCLAQRFATDNKEGSFAQYFAPRSSLRPHGVRQRKNKA